MKFITERSYKSSENCVLLLQLGVANSQNRSKQYMVGIKLASSVKI